MRFGWNRPMGKSKGKVKVSRRIHPEVVGLQHGFGHTALGKTPPAAAPPMPFTAHEIGPAFRPGVAQRDLCSDFQSIINSPGKERP